MTEEIPFIIQGFLWSLIDEKVSKRKELEYFQIFEIKAVEGGVRVIHRQEQPEWYQEVFLPVADENRVDQKIWVIDSGDQTMLYPEEY